MSLALYKPLVDNDEKIRLEAAKQLTTELGELISGEATEEAKKGVDYALKRLTRGLASGRESARPGFAVVLTEFLIQLYTNDNYTKFDLPLPSVLEVLKKNTQCAESGHTRQEERDYHLGRLFGLQSVIRSNILWNHDSNLEFYPTVLDLVFELADKKGWLRESCAWTVASSTQNWPADKAKKLAEATYSKLAASGFAKSGEGVGIWLALQVYQPKAKPAADIWSKDSPLAKSNLTKLAKVLRESGSEEDETKSKGSWSPKLGFVWDFVLRVYFSKDEPWTTFRGRSKETVAHWADFWRAVVDEGLFSSTASEERKFWGFLFFIKSLDHVTKPKELEVMFSKNLMRSFMNQLADPERYLHKVAQKALRALIARAESAPWTSPVIFKQLVSENGSPNFDQITKTKTLDKVIFPADATGLGEIFDLFKMQIMTPLVDDDESSPKIAEGRRQWAADHMLAVIRNGKTVKSENWLRRVVELFTTLGYFEIVEDGRKPVPAISETSQGMFRTRLMSVLTQLIGHAGGKMANGESWPFHAVRTLQNLEQEKSRYRSVIEFDSVIDEELTTAMQTVGQIRGNRSINAGTAVDTQLLSFELLYSLIILQVYNGESDALSVLEDLRSIQSKILAPEKKKKKSKKSKKHAESDEEDEEQDIDASVVLIDILLSFLSRQSILLKRVAHTVFTAFAPYITRAALDRCFDVLSTSESMSGQQELFDLDNPEDDEAASDMDSDELDSDVEMLSNPDADNSDSDSDLDSADISVTGDSDDENADADAALESALRTVLAPVAPTDDADSDSDMDDDAMLAMDEKLTEIFKRRKEAASKKTQKKDAKELIVAFKSKVLELLELFVKQLPTAPVALDVLLPCLTLARTTRDQKLAEKALAVVRTFAHSLKRAEDSGESLTAEADEERMWEILGELHEEAGRGGTNARKAACSSASLTVCKSLCRKDEGNLEGIIALYGKTMLAWGRGELAGVENGFFADFVTWIGSRRGALKKKEQARKVELHVREKAEVEKKEEEKEEEKGEEEEEKEEKKEGKKEGKKNKKNKKGKKEETSSEEGKKEKRKREEAAEQAATPEKPKKKKKAGKK